MTWGKETQRRNVSSLENKMHFELFNCQTSPFSNPRLLPRDISPSPSVHSVCVLALNIPSDLEGSGLNPAPAKSEEERWICNDYSQRNQSSFGRWYNIGKEVLKKDRS